MKKIAFLILIILLVFSFSASAEDTEQISGTKLFSNQSIYAKPLYILFKPEKNVHTYTSSSKEREDLENTGWIDKGILCYISPVQITGYKPLYRFCYNNLVTALGSTNNLILSDYIKEGVLGYVPSQPEENIKSIYTFVKPVYSISTIGESDYYYSDNITLSSSARMYNGEQFPGFSKPTILQKITIGRITPDNPLPLFSTVKISWESINPGGSVDILFSDDGGKQWTYIAQNQNNLIGTNNYYWQPHYVNSNQARIMIRWSAGVNSSHYCWSVSDEFSLETSDIYKDYETPVYFRYIDSKPSEPLNLVSSGMGTKGISLYWDDFSDINTGFSIIKKSESAGERGSFSVSENQISFYDENADFDIVYKYSISSQGLSENSVYSNEISGINYSPSKTKTLSESISLKLPQTPEGIFADIYENNNIKQVSLKWKPNDDHITGYVIERKTDLSWDYIASVDEYKTEFKENFESSNENTLYYRIRSIENNLLSSPSNEVYVNLKTGSDEKIKADSEDKPSTWAQKEIESATSNNLVFSDILSSYTNSITREEFCSLAVKLYEKLKDSEVHSNINPFSDTLNPDVIKAYSLRIVNGTSATTFDPYKNITRQELCVMIGRALQAAGINTSSGSNLSGYSDSNQIASWAYDSVSFCNFNNIMQGTSKTTISPLSNTTREQAIILINRTYENFRNQE